MASMPVAIVTIEQRDMNVEKKKLIRALKQAKKLSADDPESAHSSADRALLDYIGDPQVTDLFGEVHKYYA